MYIDDSLMIFVADWGKPIDALYGSSVHWTYNSCARGWGILCYELETEDDYYTVFSSRKVQL